MLNYELLTPDDKIVKSRLAKKYRRIMSKREHEKKLERLGLDGWLLK